MILRTLHKNLLGHPAGSGPLGSNLDIPLKHHLSSVLHPPVTYEQVIRNTSKHNPLRGPPHNPLRGSPHNPLRGPLHTTHSGDHWCYRWHSRGRAWTDRPLTMWMNSLDEDYYEETIQGYVNRILMQKL